MAKNVIQFQHGISLAEFLDKYGTENQCRDALFKWRWPNGFVCPECGCCHYCEITERKVYQCNDCHHQTSLISGTIFENTKLPLTTWFLGIYFITQSKNGISALELKRHLGIGYNAAWRMKHKLMQVMKESDDSKKLFGNIQLDDVYWGGEHHGGKRGRGASNKTPFVAAVQINNGSHPIAMRCTRVGGFRKKEIARWARRHLEVNSVVITDGLKCFNSVEEAGCQHQPIVTGGGHASMTIKYFTWINTMIGNIKNSIHGTYHSISSKHLPRYLAEFCYRFNRRFNLAQMIEDIGRSAMHTPPIPQKLLILAEGWG